VDEVAEPERVAFPRPQEQIFIASRLDQDLLELGVLTLSTRREIALLLEYRTRIIADVVTGKLDVRQAAAKLPEEGDLLGESADGSDCGDRLEN